MKVTSRLTKIVGVTSLAVLMVTGLTACGSGAGTVNQDYLVLSNVSAIDCSTVDSPKTVANDLQATADFVKTASAKQNTDILALNKDQTSLDPLQAALSAKVTECGGATLAGNDDSIVLSPELKALLDAANAPLDQYTCTTVVTKSGGTVIDGTYTLFVNTILEVKEGDLNLRQWSDALSTVLKGSTADEMRTWLNRGICEEPVIGVALAHLFAHLKVGDTTVLSLQTSDWLKPFAVDAGQINDLVAKYTPLTVWKLQNPGKSDVPDDVYLAALKANHEYQNTASRLIFLLSRYQLGQVMSINSTHHYHLVAGGLAADGIPEVEISSEVDSRPSLVFFLTEKTACKPISVLAFNTGDKRPMLGDIPESCESLVPPVPGTPGNPGTPGTPGTPGNPGCTENCGTPPCTENCNPPCYDDCVKDRSDNVDEPDGVDVQPNDPYEPRPDAPVDPAPVNPGGDNSGGSDTPAQGSDPGTGNAPPPPPATGTTPDGGTGTVNPDDGGPNDTDPGNPF